MSAFTPEEKEYLIGNQTHPCSCGRKSTRIVQTAPREKRYPARVAVECTACGKRGPDTCHGNVHATRRWNYVFLLDEARKKEGGAK